MKFTIEKTEVWGMTFQVEAETPDEALEKVSALGDNDAISTGWTGEENTYLVGEETA